MPAVRVLIADDHELMREGTAALLRSDPRLEVTGLAADGAEAVTLAQATPPDVALLDLRMPACSGLEACFALRRSLPSTRVLILTASERETDALAALRAGAVGYLLKDMAPRELVAAVLDAAHAEPGIDANVAQRLVSGDTARAEPIDALTDREREVLELLAEGLRNREIADRLVVSETTVKTHVRHVLEKLRFRSRAEAAAFAARLAGR